MILEENTTTPAGNNALVLNELFHQKRMPVSWKGFTEFILSIIAYDATPMLAEFSCK